MKELLEWIDRHGGLFNVLWDLGLGLFVILTLARCALDS